MMDKVFNINRFWKLVKKETALYHKQYLFIICGLLAYFIIAVLVYSLYNDRVLLQFMPVIYVVMIVCVSPFLDKNLNESNISFYLSTPASSFERFLAMWCKNVIVFPLIIFIISCLLDAITSVVLNEDYVTLNFVDSFSTIHFLFAVQSIFMFGYVYFKKKAFVKTLIAITVMFILVISISQIMVTQFYPEILKLKNNMHIMPNYNGQGIGLFFSRGFFEATGLSIPLAYDISRGIIQLVFPIGVWVLSYFKLRETEI